MTNRGLPDAKDFEKAKEASDIYCTKHNICQIHIQPTNHFDAWFEYTKQLNEELGFKPINIIAW